MRSQKLCQGNYWQKKWRFFTPLMNLGSSLDLCSIPAPKYLFHLPVFFLPQPADRQTVWLKYRNENITPPWALLHLFKRPSEVVPSLQPRCWFPTRCLSPHFLGFPPAHFAGVNPVCTKKETAVTALSYLPLKYKHLEYSYYCHVCL